MFRIRIPAIPECTTDPHSIQNSVISLKEAVEIMSGQRGAGSGAVTWDDLVRLDLISRSDVPK